MPSSGCLSRLLGQSNHKLLTGFPICLWKVKKQTSQSFIWKSWPVYLFPIAPSWQISVSGFIWLAGFSAATVSNSQSGVCPLSLPLTQEKGLLSFAVSWSFPFQKIFPLPVAGLCLPCPISLLHFWAVSAAPLNPWCRGATGVVALQRRLWSSYKQLFNSSPHAKNWLRLLWKGC